MLDGTTIKYRIEDFEVWKQLANLSFTNTVATDTGEISTKKRYDEIITTHRAKWETFDLIVKEVFYIITGKKVFHLTIKGSLHKNQYTGANYLPFTWHQLQQQINHICKTLHIDPTQAQISTLEVGVNIITPFVVTPFIMQNIINYKGDPFNRYEKDGNGFCLGIYCRLSQYKVKIYDKGKQHQLPQNLMRFEKKCFKMQEFNRGGIKFLSDLQNRPKVECLLKMLLDAWQNVLIFDIEDLQKLAITNNLKKGEIDLLISGQNPKYWERLKKENIRQFNYQRERFKILLAKIGNNWQQLVKGLIQNEWQELFKNRTNLPTGENDKLYNLTIKVKGKNVQNRFCLSCGKDISHQRKGSKFCGAKYVGKVAAQFCRDKDCNPRNNLKNKIEKITRRGVLFDITPFIIPIKLYKH